MPTTRDLPPADRALRGRLGSARRWATSLTPAARSAATEPARRARRQYRAEFVARARAAFPGLNEAEAGRIATVLQGCHRRTLRELGHESVGCHDVNATTDTGEVAGQSSAIATSPNSKGGQP